MKTIVISGGTDGIGRHLAQEYARRGDRVIVLGRSAGKGRAVLAACGERAVFRPVDLSLIGQNHAVIADIVASYPVVDALVLCARYYRSTRAETTEGIEHTFALFYLSRYLLSYGLRESLERADTPVIVNVAGPGADLTVVNWDDLQFIRGYHGGAALGQGGKLNDLLGVAFAARHPTGRTRYALVHPGVTATSFAGEYDGRTSAAVENLRRGGKPVSEAAAPIIDLIDAPPSSGLSAYVEGNRIEVRGRGFDAAAARRLDAVTRTLLTGVTESPGL